MIAQVLLAMAVTLSTTTALGAETPLPAGLVSAIPVQLAGSAEDLDGLAARLEELLAGVAPAVRMVRVADGDPVAFLRTDIGDSDLPAAWVMVARGKARVRVASAGRARFVFRVLRVASPLSQLDGERIGQALRMALATVIEAEAEPLVLQQRDETPVAPRAEDALPRPEAPIPSPKIRTAPAGVLAARPLLEASLPKRSWSLGALYEVQRVTFCRCGAAERSAGLFQSAGALVAVAWNRVSFRPELSVSGQYHLPMAIPNFGDASLSGVSLHLAGSAQLLPTIQWGLGLGIDRLQVSIANIKTLPGWFSLPGPQLRGLGRAFVRFGPFATGPVSISVTLLVELSPKGTEVPDSLVDRDPVYQDGRVRPGLAAELRWR